MIAINKVYLMLNPIKDIKLYILIAQTLKQNIYHFKIYTNNR